MKTILSFFLVSVLGLYCSAQENAKWENDDLLAMKQALSTENAPEYASVFDENATWDGPLGESAIGPENIKRAAHLMFRTFGPLEFAGVEAEEIVGRYVCRGFVSEGVERSQQFVERHSHSVGLDSCTIRQRSSSHAGLEETR